MLYDISRCWSTTCQRREQCERFIERKNSSPATGHHDHLCGPTFAAFVAAQRKEPQP